MKKIEIFGLETVPIIKDKDDLIQILYKALKREGFSLQEKDIIVFSSKIIAKASGFVFDLKNIKPSKEAILVAYVTGKDPREIEVMLKNASSIEGEIPLRAAYKKFGKNIPLYGGIEDKELEDLLNKNPALLLTTLKDGSVATSGREDDDNVEGTDNVMIPPLNSDLIAKSLREKIKEQFNIRVSCIVSDTEFRVLRSGTLDIAIGISGITPIRKEFGKFDLSGKRKIGGIDAVGDALTAASCLLMGQTDEGIPIVIIRGLEYEFDEDSSSKPLSVSMEYLSWGFFYNLKTALKFFIIRKLAFIFYPFALRRLKRKYNF